MLFEKVNALCKNRKITIAKLERECDMGNGTVRGWKASSPSVENLKKVADYFNITVDELITTDGRKRREEWDRFELMEGDKNETDWCWCRDKENRRRIRMDITFEEELTYEEAEIRILRALNSAGVRGHCGGIS